MILRLVLLVSMIVYADTIKCMIGWGQIGKLHQSSLEWPRNCVDSTYCWKASTTDMSVAQKMFTYHWDAYYDQYFVKGCGGEFGTLPLTAPVALINVTRPVDIRGIGGQVTMSVEYSCSTDFCSSATRAQQRLLVTALMICVTWYLLPAQ